MGAWGMGMQANDTAMDAICDYQDDSGQPIKNINVETAIRKGLDYDTYGDKLSGGNGTLGIADFLLDGGYNLDEFKYLIQPALDIELQQEELDHWKDPPKRKDCLLRFQARLNGEKIDMNQQHYQNRELFERLDEHLIDEENN